MKNKLKHLISLLAIVVFIIAAIGSSDTNEPVKPDPLLAYSFAEDFIKERLKAPSTAEFPGLFEKKNHVKSLGNGEYQINSWVDSQNGFGAMIRSRWACKIKFVGDKVQAENIIID